MKVRILLYKSKVYKDGTSPVIATVNINSSPKRRVLFSILPKYWDEKNNIVKKTHPMHVKLNELITEKQYIYVKKIIDAEINNIPITDEYIFSENNHSEVMLTDVVKNYIDILKRENKTTRYFENIVDDIKEFGDININNITNDWGRQLYYNMRKKNVKNTVAKKIQRINTTLKTVNMRINIDTPTEKSTKDKLSSQELLEFINVKLIGNIDMARDTFILAFCLRGRRIGDILTLEPRHIINDRLIKDANKTEKQMNIKLIPLAKKIIEKYKGKSDYYIIPYMKIHPDFCNTKKYKKQIESKTSTINKYLKIIADMLGIEKNITTHVSRHTFAYLADIHGMSSKRIQDMLEHSDLRTTENYIHDLNNSDLLDREMDDFMSKLMI